MKRYTRIFGIKIIIFIYAVYNMLMAYCVKLNIDVCEGKKKTLDLLYEDGGINYLEYVCFGFEKYRIILIIISFFMIHFKLRDEIRYPMILKRKKWHEIVKSIFLYIFSTSAIMSVTAGLWLVLPGYIIYGNTYKWGSDHSYSDKYFGLELFRDAGLNVPIMLIFTIVELFFIVCVIQLLYTYFYLNKINIWCVLGVLALYGYEAPDYFDELDIFFNYVTVNWVKLYTDRVSLIECVVYPVILIIILMFSNLLFGKRKIKL